MLSNHDPTATSNEFLNVWIKIGWNYAMESVQIEKAGPRMCSSKAGK